MKISESIDDAIETNAVELRLQDLNVKEFPEEIFRLLRLRRLRITNADFEEIPKEITKLTNLNYLALFNTKLKSIPIELCSMPNLDWLVLRGNQIEKLPDEISHLPNLKHLICAESNLKSFPDSLKNHAKLESIVLKDNQLTSFLEDFSGMPKLKEIMLLGNPLKEFPFGAYDLKKKINLRVDSELLGNLNGDDELWSFIKTCQRNKYNKETFIHYFNIAANHTEKIDKINRKIILQGINSKIPIVVGNGLENLAPTTKAIKLNAGDRIYITVKTATKKAELKKRLKQFDFYLVDSLDNETNHLLIGENIKNLPEIEDSKLPLITEQQLLRFLDKLEDKPVIASSLEEKQHVKDLIMSMVDANMTIAVELLGNGGGEDFLTELFIVNKFCEDTATRKKAKVILSKKASNIILGVLKKTKKLNEVLELFYIKYHIESYAKHTELDAAKIAEAMYTKFGIGTGYILSNGSEEQQLNLLNKLIQGDSLCINNGELTKFPETLLRFKQLKKLEINTKRGAFFRLENHFESIVNAMPDLEEIAISKMSIFPDNVSNLEPFLKLKKLKKISIIIQVGFLNSVEVMFPNCEVVDLR